MIKKIFQIALLLTVVAWTTTPANAQKKLKEGVITLTLEDLGDDNPQMAMMNGSTMTFFFSGDKNRVDVNMMGGMMRINAVTDNKDAAKNFVLMDMMGMKYHIVEIDPEEMGATNSFSSFDNLSDIKYDKKDRKNILGYDCYKATATNEEGQSYVYYITDRIQPPKPANESANMLEGFPLRMEIDLGMGDGSKMVFTATEIEPKVDKEAFTPPADTEGYQKITMEEFLKEMNSMGN
ncbi:MAG: hypothetical protein CMN32_16755 [Saprospirales bacterium]|nr:hypothetical protein [Saprospirales bacterium]